MATRGKERIKDLAILILTEKQSDSVAIAARLAKDSPGADQVGSFTSLDHSHLLILSDEQPPVTSAEQSGNSATREAESAPSPILLTRLDQLSEQLRGFTGDLLVWFIESSDAMSSAAVDQIASLVEIHQIEDNEITFLTGEYECDPLHQPAQSGFYGRVGRGSKGRLISADLIETTASSDFESSEPIELYRSSLVLSYHAQSFPISTMSSSESDSSTWRSLRSHAKSMVGRGQRAGAFLSKSSNAILTVEPDAECKYCDPSPRVSPQSGILVVREEALLAIDQRGFNSGQLMILPRRHITTFSSLSGREMAAICQLMQEAESMMRKLYTLDGLNIGCQSGVGKHLVIQLIPRWIGDLNFLPIIGGLKPIPDSPQSAWVRYIRELS